ncbi:hypothetical protein [Okeania sp. KiyG1]|nr:hypothetical protein [Okeania sp. KiyG1]
MGFVDTEWPIKQGNNIVDFQQDLQQIPPSVRYTYRGQDARTINI